MKIIIGSAQFGLNYGIANNFKKVDANKVKNILNLAYLNKINTIDTATAYGSSEKILGKFIKSNFIINSKLPFLYDVAKYSSQLLKSSIDESLNKLQIKSLNCLFIHSSKDVLSLKETNFLKDLNDLRNKGLFKKVGLSIYSPNELEKIWSFFKPDIVQVPYNILDQRIVQSGWMEKLKDSQVEVHTRSTFLQGVLLNKDFIYNKFFSKWYSLLNKWFLWCENNNMSLLDVALAMPINNKNINKVVIGINSELQLKQIIKSLSKNILEVPNIKCDDENLLNPSNWVDNNPINWGS